MLRPLRQGTAHGGHYYEIEIYPHPLCSAAAPHWPAAFWQAAAANRQQFRSAQLCQQFSRASPASSEVLPDSTTRADTSGLNPGDFDENSIFSITGTSAAFEPCLGWGPGVSGCSLKSVIAAASLLQWAENARLASRTPDAVQEAFYSWYDTLDADEQESFAEAWTMIEPDALSLVERQGQHDWPHRGCRP